MHNREYENQQIQEDLLDLNEVMQAFGISDWKNLGPAEPSYAEDLNLLIEVQGQHYVLKERVEGPVGEDPHRRYIFQQYLRQNGIPIPALWLTPQGEPMVMVGEDSFELQQWVGGEPFTTVNPRSLDWVDYAGTMLGRIHQTSQHYPGPQYRWPSEVHIGAQVQGWLNLARTKAEESEIQAIASALSNWVDQWESVLPSTMVSIGAGSNLPELHIHGDYHAHNLRFGPFGVTAVMGFEASHWEKRIFEVATGLFSFSALQWQTDSSLTHPLVKRGFEPERARRFLQAYREIYPPVRGEATLLADALMLIAPIATINGPLEDLFYTQEGMNEALIDDVMERLSWASSLPAWLGRVRRSLQEMWE
jgi:Ser/Thr protein kinase RdoA (MazF antagonist)